jgi:hypothetical protein
MIKQLPSLSRFLCFGDMAYSVHQPQQLAEQGGLARMRLLILRITDSASLTWTWLAARPSHRIGIAT